MAGIPVEPAGWARPSGYSNGMRARGEVLAISGQVAWDAHKRIVGDTFAAQFAQALANVVAIVRAAGATPQDIISLTIYVVDRAEYLGALAQVGAEYRAQLGKHFPAMALVEVSGLVEPGAKLEIQGLACIPEAP